MLKDLLYLWQVVVCLFLFFTKAIFCSMSKYCVILDHSLHHHCHCLLHRKGLLRVVAASVSCSVLTTDAAV